LLGLLHGNTLADDKPPPGRYIEVEIERDTGNATPTPLLDEATLKAFQKWRFKPKKVRRVKIPMPFTPIPPAVPSGPVTI
jgi:TonB family protein